jgi:hypothetical protein
MNPISTIAKQNATVFMIANATKHSEATTPGKNKDPIVETKDGIKVAGVQLSYRSLRLTNNSQYEDPVGQNADNVSQTKFHGGTTLTARVVCDFIEDHILYGPCCHSREDRTHIVYGKHASSNHFHKLSSPVAVHRSLTSGPQPTPYSSRIRRVE